MTKAILVALGLLTLSGAALPAHAEAQNQPQTQPQSQTGCSVPSGITVTSAYKHPVAKLDEKATEEQKKDAARVELGDTIELTIDGLEKLQEDAVCRKSKGLPKRTLVVFLAGQAMKGLTGYTPQSASAGKMRFDLAHTDESKAAWALVLAKPWIRDRDLDVSVGYEDSSPFDSSGIIPFRKLTTVWALLGIAFMAVLIAIFLALLWWTDMCREGRPVVPSDVVVPSLPSEYGPYSLSKVQAGIWFLVILGAYIFIVMVTHDISGTINGTALTLLGIGAATMVGSAVIKTNQGEGANVGAQEKSARELAQRIQALNANPPKDLTPAEAAQQMKDLYFAFKRATNQSIGIWNDIVSDANGVNFHRFQMAAWTVVLSFIFAVAVTRILAMPDFDTTLLALQGLSAGTYLGLKVSEPKVTTVPNEKPQVADPNAPQNPTAVDPNKPPKKTD